MKKYAVSLLAILLALSLILAGCGAKTAPDASGAQSAEPSESGSESSEATEESSGTAESSESSESSEPTAEKTVIRVGGMTGPTSMGMVGMMKADGSARLDYEFSIVGSADELTPMLIRGELDAAAVPANLASVLYNNTEGEIQFLAVNTLGVTYIVQKGEEVSSLDDLRGRTLYATGKGSVPEYTLRYLLTANGIDPDSDLTIEWKSEPAEIVALLNGSDGIAMLPQPYVTVAMGQVEGLEVAVNLSEEWDALDNGSRMITGVMAIRKDFAEQNPDAVKAFLEDYAESVGFVNADASAAAQLIEENGIFKAAVAEKAIPACNIVLYSGEEARAMLEGYLQVLFEQNPKALGGQMPDDGFYWKE